MIYCVIPRQLAGELHEPLWEFFGDQPEVQVVVERRGAERRAGPRRAGQAAPAEDRRVVRSQDGRRVADRRAPGASSPHPELPPIAQPHADALTFVRRKDPPSRQLEDEDSARLVIRAQQGDEEAVPELYLRYYEPLYSYLKLLLKDAHEAEDLVQDVFTQILGVIPRYEVRAEQPFRVLLYRIARNRSIDHYRKTRKVDVQPPDGIAREHEAPGSPDPADMIERLSDSDLAVFLRRLPENQLHVLLLRYMLDFTPEEAATVLNTSPDGARAMQYRALQYLRKAAAEGGF